MALSGEQGRYSMDLLRPEHKESNQQRIDQQEAIFTNTPKVNNLINYMKVHTLKRAM